MTEPKMIDRNGWAGFFDQLSADHQGDITAIELFDTDFGDQYETERLPFTYASYDRKDDVIVIGVGGNSARSPVLLRRMIHRPVEVDAAVPAPGQSDIRIVAEDGTTTMVHLRPGAALPGPR
ncbi:DUF5335 family protein [Actinoallomurus rhizosphaericola]|uniref:DUF5335 family protein n=1 Tax=Actinoallomurus rhizosphaericola TaxID=2952536 RepID=UPI002093BA64|nr:DUF5335 family protein [Actinoallomurus rhizosphaericola]MCO5997839.1 DUF5335 domain-containing protein [Actinoallomurus rhizosphaericola]